MLTDEQKRINDKISVCNSQTTQKFIPCDQSYCFDPSQCSPMCGKWEEVNTSRCNMVTVHAKKDRCTVCGLEYVYP